MEKIIELEGYADDLLQRDNNNQMVCTRLFKLDPNSTEINEEIVDICLMSTNMNGEHPLFNKVLGKKIRMTVEVIE